MAQVLNVVQCVHCLDVEDECHWSLESEFIVVSVLIFFSYNQMKIKSAPSYIQ